MSQPQTGSFSVKSSHPFVNPQPQVDSSTKRTRTGAKGKRVDQQPASGLTQTHSANGHAIRQVYGSVADYY